MAARSPGLQARSQYPRDWGNYVSAAVLPNASGAPLPAPAFANLEAGDTAYVPTATPATNIGVLYVCSSPGTVNGGDAAWVSQAPVSLDFDGYDFTGGTALGLAPVWTPVPLDTERVTTPQFGHVAPSSTVTVLVAGRYQILGTVSTTNTINRRSESAMRLALNGSGVPGTRRPIYNRNGSQGSGSATCAVVLDLAAGDVVELEAQHVSGTGSLVLEAEGSELLLRRVS